MFLTYERGGQTFAIDTNGARFTASDETLATMQKHENVQAYLDAVAKGEAKLINLPEYPTEVPDTTPDGVVINPGKGKGKGKGKDKDKGFTASDKDAKQ